MVNRFSSALNEARANLRVRERRRVSWHLKDQDLKGAAIVRNISVSGMLLETDCSLPPQENRVFSFDSVLGDYDFIPLTGRLIWHKKKHFPKNRYLWGIQFVEPSEYVLSRLHQRVQKGIRRLTAIRRTTSVMSLLLLLASLSLAWYALWLNDAIYRDIQITNQKMLSVAAQQAALTQEYKQRYQDTTRQLISVTAELAETQNLYQQSQLALQNISNELESTKALLAKTEAMLAQAKEGNMQLQQQISAFGLWQGAESSSSNGVQTIQAQLIPKAEQIRTPREGRTLLALYRDGIRVVQSRMKAFQQEAHEARIAILKEKDKIKSLLGNNGYFVRDGASVKVDRERYEAATLGFVPAEGTVQAPRNVKIDVTFFK